MCQPNTVKQPRSSTSKIKGSYCLHVPGLKLAELPQQRCLSGTMLLASAWAAVTHVELEKTPTLARPVRLQSVVVVRSPPALFQSWFLLCAEHCTYMSILDCSDRASFFRHLGYADCKIQSPVFFERLTAPFPCLCYIGPLKPLPEAPKFCRRARRVLWLRR